MTLFSFANCVKKDNVLKIFCYFPEKPFKNVAGEQQKSRKRTTRLFCNFFPKKKRMKKHYIVTFKHSHFDFIAKS